MRNASPWKPMQYFEGSPTKEADRVTLSLTKSGAAIPVTFTMLPELINLLKYISNNINQCIHLHIMYMYVLPIETQFTVHVK